MMHSMNIPMEMQFLLFLSQFELFLKYFDARCHYTIWVWRQFLFQNIQFRAGELPGRSRQTLGCPLRRSLQEIRFPENGSTSCTTSDRNVKIDQFYSTSPSSILFIASGVNRALSPGKCDRGIGTWETLLKSRAMSTGKTRLIGGTGLGGYRWFTLT